MSEKTRASSPPLLPKPKKRTTVGGVIVCNLTHAKIDPSHCIAPIYRSLRPNERKNSKLDVTYIAGESTIRFTGPEPLGVDDMRVMQGLLALAPVCGSTGGHVELPVNPATDEGRALRELLETKFDAKDMKALVVKGSYRELAKEIGYADIDGGATFKLLRECIERLWTVSVFIERPGGKRMGFRILSDYASDATYNQLFVGLNPVLTAALLGGGQFYKLSLEEARQLKTDPARLIHQRLHFINEGYSYLISLDKLCSYVWPEPTVNPNTQRTRQRTCKKALDELAQVGWKIEESTKNNFKITRPKPRNIAIKTPEYCNQNPGILQSKKQKKSIKF